jgi:hypothetical protein
METVMASEHEETPAELAARLLADGLALLNAANGTEIVPSGKVTEMAALACASFTGGLLVLNLESARSVLSMREQAKSQLTEMMDALKNLAPGGARADRLPDRFPPVPGLSPQDAAEWPPGQ